MSYTKRTMRKMRPSVRALAAEINALELSLRRLKRLLVKLESVEMDADLHRAGLTRPCSWCGHPALNVHKCEPSEVAAFAEEASQ